MDSYKSASDAQNQKRELQAKQNKNNSYSHSPTYLTTPTIIKASTLKEMKESDLALQHWEDPTIALNIGVQNARQIYLSVDQQQFPLYQ